MLSQFTSLIVVAIQLLLINNSIQYVSGQSAETLLRTFDWDAKLCSDYPFGSDYYKCGVLIFCQLDTPTSLKPLYGYKQSDSLTSENNICSSPGPTFRVEPGKKYLLTLFNSVTGQKTNLHTHGAHISGDGNADNILRIASTNQAIHYNWNIPIDHMGGTHWYHSHKHEASYLQTLGGAMGLFIVEDTISSLIPADILTNPSVGPNIIEFLSKNNEKIIMGTNIQEKFHGNGKQGGSGNINIIKDTWTRVRLGVSDPKQNPGRARQTIEFLPYLQKVCTEAYVIAYDGIYRTNFISNDTTSQFKTAHLPVDIVGSGRIDIAVRCNTTGTVDLYWGSDRKLITFTVIEPPVVPRAIQPDPYNYISITNETTLETTLLKSSWIPNRPYYNRDLSNYTMDQLNNTAVSLITTDFKINQIVWDPKVAFRFDNVNDINEWNISGTTNGHPLHLHIHHFQIMSPDCGKHEQYQFYDTISSPEPCIVRFPYNDFAGLTVLHCHDLEHEDGGMMTWVDVSGTDGIETTRPNVNDIKFYPKPKSNSCMAKTEFNCKGGDGRSIKAGSGTTCIERCVSNPDTLVGTRTRKCTFPFIGCRNIPRWQCGYCKPPQLPPA